MNAGCVLSRSIIPNDLSQIPWGVRYDPNLFRNHFGCVSSAFNAKEVDVELNEHTDAVLPGFPYKNILLTCTLALALAVAGYGQMTGQPLTQTSGGVGLPSPLVLDATRFNGSPDACAQIRAAITQMNSVTNNGVVDARGFTGSVECASNMFPLNATGKLLLGNVVLNVSKTQVQPSQFQVEGTGWTFAAATNTRCFAQVRLGGSHEFLQRAYLP
jgi:hypothetical protein